MSFPFADNKYGGRFTACFDAIGAGHLNRAAGILAEIVDELNQEATEAGLLADEAPVETPGTFSMPQATPATSMDLQMCSRGVHSFGPPDPVSGWRECATCGNVNIAPPADA